MYNFPNQNYFEKYIMRIADWFPTCEISFKEWDDDLYRNIFADMDI